jgi:hypothetical protein
MGEAAQDHQIGSVKGSLQEGARAAAIEVDPAVPWAAHFPACLDSDSRGGRA